MELAVLREALDRDQLRAVGLHREHQAGARGLAVDQDRARTTNAVLAADVRPREAEVLADEVDQQLARGAAALAWHAVDRQPDGRELAAIHGMPSRARA